VSEYAIKLSQRAVRQLKELPRQVRARITSAIDSLATDPRPAASTNLKELPGCYRLREGDHRVIYTVVDDKLIVLVLAVAARKESYNTKEIATIRKLLREMLH
jgi:mRNA interferase RelE/StbE